MLNLKKIIGGLCITSAVSLGIAGLYGYTNIDTNNVEADYTVSDVIFTDIVEKDINHSIRGTIANVDTFLSVRSSADINGKVVDKLLNNSEFEIIGVAGDWYEISYNNKIGFINKDYVTIEKETVFPMNNYKLENLSAMTVNFNPEKDSSTKNIELSTEEILEMNLNKNNDEESEKELHDDSVVSSSENVPKGRAIKAELTAYCNDEQCSEGWSNQTAMETTTRVGVIAAPPEIALGSKIYIPELQSNKEDGIFSVEDRGGAIKIKDDGTYIIDVWMPTHEEVEAFGRKTTTIYLMDE